MPSLLLENHHPLARPRLRWLENLILKALPLCLEAPGPEESQLPHLEEVSFNFIDDDTMVRVHEEFLADPTTTDVITFHHGEILVGIDYAKAQAKSYHNTWHEEILLYMIHGLLHLHGHEDQSTAGAARMKVIQERIHAMVLDRPRPS